MSLPTLSIPAGPTSSPSPPPHEGESDLLFDLYNLVLTTDFAGYTTVDPLPISFKFWNREAHLRALLHRWLSVFSASFACSCTLPDGLSPSPLRATSMMRDDLLCHLLISPKLMPRTVQLRIYTHQEHYPILTNSSIHLKWPFAGHHCVYVCERDQEETE